VEFHDFPESSGLSTGCKSFEVLSISHPEHAEGVVGLREFSYLEDERVEARCLLADLEVKPPSAWRTVLAYMRGTVALVTSFFLLALIIIGHLTTQ